MRILSAAFVLAIFGLATACSGGGSSAPVGTVPNTDQDPTEGGSSGVPTEGASRVPALPGLIGYDLRESGARAALALADESVDVLWAEETKDSILAELSDLIIAPNNLVAIECRTTWCGVVVDGPDTRDSDLDNVIGDRLRELFDVRSVSTHSIGRPEGDWIAAYIEIVRLV